MSSKRKKNSPPEPQSLLQRAQKTLETTLETLDLCANEVHRSLSEAAAKKERYNDKLASHNAYLAEHAATVSREIRASEAHVEKAVAAMDPAERDRLVFAYAVAMPADKRAQLRALLDDTDETESLLG